MKGKRILALLTVLLMVVYFIPTDCIAVMAATSDGAVMSVGEVEASPGDTVTVDVSIANNPGILGASLKVEYDSGLTLVKGEKGEAVAPLDMTAPGKYQSPCNFLFNGTSISGDQIFDGSVLKLTFQVPDDAVSGQRYAINVTCQDVIDNDLNPLEVTVQNGYIAVDDYLPGDLNGDKKVNTIDSVQMKRFVAGGYDLTINEAAADVNADWKINTLDVVILQRYIVGGYNVKLVRRGQLEVTEPHELTRVEPKSPTCTEPGNNGYWYCSECKKYYSDAQGVNEIAQDQTILDATGHTIVVDPAVEPTATSPGLTEGSHCSVCGTIIVPQKEWASNYFTIRYDIANGDQYLSKLDIENPNSTTIAEGASLYLEDLEVEGYRFLGWYDGSGSDASKVTKITNADHNLKLYAHWETQTYRIEFKSDLVTAPETEYTTKSGKVLPTLTLDGYTFVGWTDIDGNLISRVKPGTTGDLVLFANWISDRNQAWAKKKLDKPVVYEDEDVMLFIYEIGDIKNVPVYEIENFGKINSDGVELEVTKKYSVQTSESLMESYTNTVEDATTNTDSWTLSSDWNEAVSIDEQYYRSKGYTEEEIQNNTKTETGNWYITNSKGGSSSSTVVDSTDTYNLTTGTNNTKTWNDYTEEVDHGKITKTVDTKNVTHGNSAKLYAEGTASGNIGYTPPSATGGLGGGGSLSVKAGGEYEQDKHTTDNSGTETTEQDPDTTTIKGSISDEGSSTQTGSVNNHSQSTTNTATWNTEVGYGGSSSTSSSRTVAQAVSSAISETYGYGKSYVNGGGESSTQGLSHSSSSTDEYGSAVTYSTIKSEEVEATYKTTNTKSGYHRWVMASTAHVFGVAGYDIATNSYFAYTYSVMDDEMHRFEDYSYSSADFNDNQNGIISFEVPIDLMQYVNYTLFRTDGLEFDKNGIVTAYEGDDSYVAIPDYAVIDNLVGKPTVVKVTGLSENAFKGNENITGIRLSRFIDVIPDNAFKNCKNLWQVNGSVLEIGANAFDGCPLLDNWDISSAVSSLGQHAFENARYLSVKAANSSVVLNAIQSGAKNISIGLNALTDSIDGMTLDIPSTIDSIWLNGHGEGFRNLTVKSEAGQTYLNRININSDEGIPLWISSPDIRFNQCSITGSGICAALTADSTTLDLYGPVTLSTTGPNALLVKDLTTQKKNSGLQTSLKLTGDLVTCNEVKDSGYIQFTDGQVRIVDAETFDRLLHSYKLTFDANGGECNVTSRDVANGTKLGDLPVPTRTGFNFLGWQTKTGKPVDEDTIFSNGEDVTIYAQWEAKKFHVNWAEGTGYSISVERTSSPNQQAETGVLESGADIYYGDTLRVTYEPAEGFSLKNSGDTEFTVTRDITEEDIFTSADPYSYTASWTQGTGYTISVSRTESPYGGASTGTISSGATIYYGDVLNVTYKASTGYSLGSHGQATIIVNSNVTSSQIYASATANSYTYNIVYKSSHGTALGTSSATYKYGTSNKISAPAKSGYTTPAAQTVSWNSTSPKTITFTYTPTSVASSKNISSGNWWYYNASTRIDYRVDAEYTNRTANSVQVRVKWTNTISANAYFGYAQYFNGTIAGSSYGDIQIATNSTWSGSSTSARSVTAYSPWKTVSVSATTTSVSIGNGWIWDSGKVADKSWTGGTMTIPTY